MILSSRELIFTEGLCEKERDGGRDSVGARDVCLKVSQKENRLGVTQKGYID